MLEITSDLPMIALHMYQLTSGVTITLPAASFLCILRGPVTLTRSDCIPQRLQSEDVLYLSPESTCRIHPEKSALLLYVEFHPYFLLSTLGFDYKALDYDSRSYPPNGAMKFLYDLAALSVSCLTSQEDRDCQTYARAYQILHHMVLANSPDTANERLMHQSESKTEKKIRQYRSYIQTNYYHALNLSQAAEHLSYTPPYLASFVKKNLHMTFQEHITSVRLEAAILLLCYSTEPASRISALCGFPNVSSFEHSFTNLYSMDPNAYRLTHHACAAFSPASGIQEIQDVTLELDYIYNYMHYNSTASLNQNAAQILELQANAARYIPRDRIGCQLINLGPAADFEKPAFRYALRIMQNRIPFTYGRCVGLFSLIAETKEKGGYSYDFSRLFDALDFMRSIHLLPMVELTNKPFHIYEMDEHLIHDYRRFLDVETYDAFLQRVLPHFIRACISRYGYDEFCEWKFEIWRRYTPAMDSLEEPEVYVRRFVQTAAAIKSLVPESCIGGPGFNTYLNADYFHDLMKAFADAAIQPDFVSALYFPYITKDDTYSTRLPGYTTATHGTTMHIKILRMKEKLKLLGLEQLPFYITEYCSYLSTGNYINDSTYPAAFILQQVVENCDCADVLGYWLASDMPLTYRNYAAPLFGGNGILSKDAIPKSSFFAFSFLHQLGDQIISRGSHYIATRSLDSNYQILIFHPGTLNADFSESPFNQELLYFPNSAFEDVPALDFRLHLNHMDPGTYMIKIQKINLTHGNILEAWKQLDYYKELRPTEIQYFRENNSPEYTMKLEEVKETFFLQTILNRNEATLFTLEKYS